MISRSLIRNREGNAPSRYREVDIDRYLTLLSISFLPSGALMIQTKESTSPSQSLITRRASGPAEDTFLSTPLALRNTVDHFMDGSGIELLAAALLQPE